MKRAKRLLIRFGRSPNRSNSKWQRLVNTDFSGRIGLIQKHNIKNNIIWSRSKESIPLDLQTIGQEKFSPSVLIYVGITCRGLVPNHAPIFIDEWLKVECAKIGKQKNSMDRFLYIKLVKELKRHIDQLYDDVDVIWQHDGDSKYRSYYVLHQIDDIFCERITLVEQAAKMPGGWLIENIWVFIKQKRVACEIQGLVTLRTKIVETWRSISPEICSALIRSIPRRLKCAIDKDGYGAKKEDFKKAK